MDKAMFPLPEEVHILWSHFRILILQLLTLGFNQGTILKFKDKIYDY